MIVPDLKKDNKGFYCAECKKKFNNQKGLDAHNKAKHNSNDSSSNSDYVKKSDLESLFQKFLGNKNNNNRNNDNNNNNKQKQQNNNNQNKSYSQVAKSLGKVPKAFAGKYIEVFGSDEFSVVLPALNQLIPKNKDEFYDFAAIGYYLTKVNNKPSLNEDISSIRNTLVTPKRFGFSN